MPQAVNGDGGGSANICEQLLRKSDSGLGLRGVEFLDLGFRVLQLRFCVVCFWCRRFRVQGQAGDQEAC